MNQGFDEEELARLGDKYDKDPHVQIAQLGIELRVLLGSKVGQYLENQAKEQMDDAITRLLELDIEDDPKAFRKARMDALIPQQALTWIVQGVSEGENAEKQLEQRDYME